MKPMYNNTHITNFWVYKNEFLYFEFILIKFVDNYIKSKLNTEEFIEIKTNQILKRHPIE